MPQLRRNRPHFARVGRVDPTHHGVPSKHTGAKDPPDVVDISLGNFGRCRRDRTVGPAYLKYDHARAIDPYLDTREIYASHRRDDIICGHRSIPPNPSLLLAPTASREMAPRASSRADGNRTDLKGAPLVEGWSCSRFVTLTVNAGKNELSLQRPENCKTDVPLIADFAQVCFDGTTV